MARGNWSFLHEWVVYDYLMARSGEKSLRLRKVIGSGKLLGKTKWIKIDRLLPITNTGFPDITEIKLRGESPTRPAEVKFVTSSFNYHLNNSYQGQFREFVMAHGFLLVVQHDYIPKRLIDEYPDVDIFELDLSDFVSFCRENFVRLLNRQVKAHAETRVWIMYQGPNFNLGEEKIKPARDSKIWCPTENLTGFDLAVGDRILFIKTSGASTFEVQRMYLNEKKITSKWNLNEIFLAEVKSKIFSRLEYIQYKKKSPSTKLWMNDGKKKDNSWRWGRVFEFEKIKVITTNKKMEDLFLSDRGRSFVIKSFEAFCYGKSREIPLSDYRDFLEELA